MSRRKRVASSDDEDDEDERPIAGPSSSSSGRDGRSSVSTSPIAARKRTRHSPSSDVAQADVKPLVEKVNGANRANGTNRRNHSRSRRTATAAQDSDSDEDEQMNTSTFKAEPTGDRSTASQDEDGEEYEEEDGEEAASDDEIQEDEAGDQEQIAEIQKELRDAHNRGGHVAEAGVVERVELVNFMCHKRLTVPLGPQTNFIIGHNGSGKSALLTGITIALGGKAAATNRGSSLKSFVREGCSAGEVVLWMKNKGDEAFKHDVYGDRIIIERRINADGGGHWKMKDMHSKTVSTKREELNAYCDHTNIQVDNPMNVLTQDAARQFLSSSNSSDMYDFFLRGTQLKQLSDEYEAIDLRINSMKRIVATKEEGLPELETAAREAAQKYTLVQKQKDMHKELQDLKDQVVWAQVVEREKRLEAAVNKAERMRIKKEKTVKEVDRLETLFTELNTKIAEIESRSRNDTERVSPLNEERSQLKEEMRGIKGELSKVRSEEAEQTAQYERLQKTVDDFTKRIEEEANKLAADNREKHQRLEARHKELDAQRRQLAEEEAGFRESSRNAEPQAKKLAQQEAQTIDERDRLRNQLQEREGLVQRIAAASRNSIEAYGQGVPELVRAINAEGRWHKKPVGPVGTHIKLKDERWAPLLESVIGNTLNAFCVTNHHDRRLLENLKRRLHCGLVPILTGSDEPFDFSQGEPPAEILTILRVLDIDDDFVLRMLVNAVHIEGAAIVERRPDGDQLMRKHVRNVKTCFSADMFQIKGGQVGSTTNTLNPYTGPPRLSADVTAKHEEAKAACRQTNDQLREVGERLNKIKQERQDAQRLQKETRDRITLAQRKQDRAKDELAQLQDDLRADEPANVAALEEARKEAREEQDKAREGFVEIQQRKEEIELSLKPKSDRYEELRKMIDDAMDESGAIRHELQKTVEERVKCQNELKMRTTSLQKLTGDLEEGDEEVDALKDHLDQAMSQALEYTDGRRVEAKRSHEQYETEIAGMEKRIEKMRRSGGGSLEQVVAEFRRCQKAYDDAKQSIADLKALTKMAHSALRRRLEMWITFRRYIANSAKANFTYFLNMRGYQGVLFFNHEFQKLTISVQTDVDTTANQRAGGSATQQQQQANVDGKSRSKDPRSLSGGEKSFATICLLMSLWHAIGCPIRCLDEFDVFMDAVNRKISMKMIVDASKYNHNVQYVLITPQNIANVRFGPEVNIQRLSDPERGQGVLTFGS